MKGDTPGGPIHWRMHIPAPPEVVYAALDSDAGRAAFWAESAVEADLSFPIILAADGAVMDGRHRVAKALLLGQATIEAVQFGEDPPPDHVGMGPEVLSDESG